MKAIILEGVDGSGKSTLKVALDKATNFKHVFIDRLVGSTLVYDITTGRRSRVKELLEYEKHLTDSFLLVYCYCDEDDNISRLIKKGEEMATKMLRTHRQLFDEYLEMTTLRHIVINTSKPIKDCVKKVLEFVEKNDS